MEESDLEGSLILEKLAEQGQTEAFFEALDSDDFETASRLMKQVGIDAETRKWVLTKMADSDDSQP